MVTWTYSTLTSAVVNTAEMAGDTDFSTELPNIIDRAELRLTRDLDTFGVVTNMYCSLSTGNPYLPMPSGTLAVKSISVKVNNARTNLLMKTNEWLQEYWPDRTSTASSGPKYYAPLQGVSVLTALLAPCPASTTYCEAQIVVRPSAISAGEPTNYFTQFCPGALFAAVMVETAFFMKNGPMAQLWEGRYQQEVAELRNEGRRQRRDDQRPANRDGWNENTLSASEA